MGYITGFAPYTDRLLRGDGVVVAVADTGLDDASCYFSDPYRKVNKTNTKNAKPDFRLRKVVQYALGNGADGYDNVAGHGTHVCGIVAGNSYDGDKNENIYSGTIHTLLLLLLYNTILHITCNYNTLCYM